MPPFRWKALLALSPLALGCAGTLPDPREAAKEYAEAIAKGDAEAIHGMLEEESRRELHVEDVRRLLADAKDELSEQAKSFGDPAATVQAVARVRYGDGETATLSLEDGAFKVTAADSLPASASSPAQALEQLRRVLARRSYAGLMRVLSASTRNAIESDLRTLVESLAHPEGLEIEVQGDRASVRLEGGHLVKLRREQGVWRVEDFD